MTGHIDSNWGFLTKLPHAIIGASHTEVRARPYEKARRSTCGCDAVQYVGGHSGKQGYAITLAGMRLGMVTPMAIVIEFYVPEKFRKQSGKWISPEQRGKVIPFPAQQKKSA